MNNVLDENNQVYSQSAYFADDKRKIDFILVCNKLKTKEDITKLTTYLENLAKNGIAFEIKQGIYDSNLNYVKLHAPTDVLVHLSNVHTVILQCDSRRHIVGFNEWKIKMLQTPVTDFDLNESLKERAPQTLSANLPQSLTSSERSLLLRKLLTLTRFGDEEFEIGLDNLKLTGLIDTAYPLHDSSHFWKNDGYLSDFQLLNKYWANFACILKNQPINLIRKYYGPEIAFYFAFLDFYTKMLIPAAAVGVSVFLFNIATGDVDGSITKDICNSNEYVCTQCLSPHFCGFRKLNLYCSFTTVHILFDNVSSMLFAILMSFWALCFVELWKRREKELNFAWNLVRVDSGTQLRLKYAQHTSYRRKSAITGEIEPYVPMRTMIYCHALIAVCFVAITLFLVFLVMFTVFIRHWIQRIIYKSGIELLTNNLTLVSESLGAFITVVIIEVFAPYYKKLAVKLAIKENPRTTVGFYDSCAYNSYWLAFMNNYIPLIYLTFFKGKLVTHPGKVGTDYLFTSLENDHCHPAGCLSSLSIQVLILLVCNKLIVRVIVYAATRKKDAKFISHESIPLYETDQKRKDCGHLFLLSYYLEKVIQYGFITLFAAALPLAPLFALIKNLFDVRLEATALVQKFRRPPHRRLPGIGAWNTVLKFTTFVGCITNGFIIAFTSGAVPKLFYFHNYGSLKGYLNLTMSVFLISDYKTNISDLLVEIGPLETCIYRGIRFNYNEHQKYQRKGVYFEFAAVRLGFVAVFLQVIWALMAVCSAAFDKIPARLAQDIDDEKAMITHIRLQHLLSHKVEYAHKNYTPFRL